jgi:Holliday junction resolvase
MKRLYVTNSRGEREPFSHKKVYYSCRRSGASRDLAEKISREIKKNIYLGIETSEIFEMIKQLLSGKSPKSLIRFSLKEAMMKLGPAGFDFEKYMADVFSENGFEVSINRVIPGLCISDYEIDLVIEKEDIVYIVECKYHRLPGNRVDLKVGLSNYARFLDISRGKNFKGFDLKTMIVTNGKFTSELIRYSKCMNVELLGWRYPPRMGLERLIEDSKLYPVTILPSFKPYFKRIFAEKRMMVISDILKANPSRLARELRLPSKEIEKLIEEAKTLFD